MSQKSKKIGQKRVKKSFSLSWLFDPFRDDDRFYEKRMFGALAAYYRGKLVLLISETLGDRSWKGVSYNFDIWYGLLIPTSQEHHASIRSDFPVLRRHPVLAKWLFLPIAEEQFEQVSTALVEKIIAGDERFGIFPKVKTGKTKKDKK